MPRWMKVMAVALAVVVSFVPIFTQLGYAQASSEPLVVLPSGEELPDEVLLEAEGGIMVDDEDRFFIGLVIFELAVGALAGWHSYQEKGSVVEAVEEAVYTMTIFTIGLAAGIYLPR